MKTIFITSTGTGIGKTYVATKLIKYYLNKNLTVRAIKPIESGFNENDHRYSDAGTLLSAQDLEISRKNVDTTTPWRFRAPLSPHMAAQFENQGIDFQKLVLFCEKSKNNNDILLIEGAGGVMVPLNSKQTFLDLIQVLQCEVILVVGSYLGTISHTLTAISALETRNIYIKQIIVNESEGSSVSLAQTIEGLKPFVQHPIFGLERGSNFVEPMLASHSKLRV